MIQNFKVMGASQKKIQKKQEKEFSCGCLLNTYLMFLIIGYMDLLNLIKGNGCLRNYNAPGRSATGFVEFVCLQV